MGIQGLLPLLNGITNTTHISSYKNKKVAIDVYCWLHKGVYSCSMELCLDKPTTRYVDYCLKRLKLLQEFGVIPIVVFDGGPLPMKSKTESERRKTRDESKARGLQYLKEGNSEAALDCFQKAVDITPQMAHNLIKALQRENIDYVVAPYEADAQLAFLSLGKHVDCIITEDSDLLAYGCSRILFKMDKDGYGKEICITNLPSIQKPSFANFTQSMLRQLCILSGCDYVSSLSGLGIKTAHSLIKKHKSVDKVLQAIKSSRTYDIPNNYEELVYKAELTFLHQRVFDHTQNQVLPLTPLPTDLDIENTDFLGPPIAQELAIQIAVGLADPISKRPYVSLVSEKHSDLSQSETFVVHNIEEKEDKSKKVMKRSLSLPVQKNNISSYFATSDKSKPFVPPRINKSETDEVTTTSPTQLHKKQKTLQDTKTSVLLVPDSPERVQKSYKIISKYFKNDNGSSKAESNNLINTNFASPYLNNNTRLSLFHSSHTFSYKEEEEEEEVSIKSDTEEEAIKSDDDE